MANNRLKLTVCATRCLHQCRPGQTSAPFAPQFSLSVRHLTERRKAVTMVPKRFQNGSIMGRGGVAMPSITVKSIPDELYERIKQSAAEHRRSINKEVIICLERTLLARRVNPAVFLARADALREQSNLPPLTDRILRKAKAEGPP